MAHRTDRARTGFGVSRRGRRLFGAAVAGAVAIGAVAAGPARAATVLEQFQGATLSQSGFVPPDMGGAVGNGDVMQMLNGAVSVYTVAGSQIGGPQSLNTFWSNAGLSSAIGTTSVSDPRVIFDPASQLWFASAISTQGTNNNILVAVSKTANPTGGFTGFSVASASSQFADFPTLGVNGAAVTIGTNNFTSSAGSFSGVSLYSIPKASLTAITPSVANISRFDQTNAVGIAPQAVTNASGNTTTTSVVSVGNGSTPPVYALSTVTGANAGGAALSLTTTYDSTTIANAALLNTTLVGPTQPGLTTYDPGDSRISSGAYQAGNNIYFANTVANATINATSDVISWAVLNATTSGVVAQGTLSMSGLSLTYPSISANANGTFVIAFNGSGTGTNITDYYVICSAITGTCGAPQTALASPASNYNVAPAGTNRWGDYSWTTVDPTNPNDFWLFQEYASNSSTWATVITEIGTAVPEPAGIAVFAAALVGLGLVRRRVRSGPA